MEPAEHTPIAMKDAELVNRKIGMANEGRMSAATPAQKVPTNTAINTDSKIMPTLRILLVRAFQMGWG